MKVRELYTEAAQHIYGPLRSYWLNYAFVRGLQWLDWNKTMTRLVDMQDQDGDRLQATFNRIRANQRSIIANATKEKLGFEITPSSPDDESVAAARLGEAVLRDLAKAQGWEVIREENLHGTFKGGTGFLMTEIDPTTRLPTVVPLSIAECTPEPGSRRAEYARYCIKVQAIPPKMVKAMFKMRTTPPADARAGVDPFQHRLLHYGYGTESVSPDLTTVYTYYERPLNGSKGRFIVEVDGKTVQSGKWPFPFTDRLNIAVMRETVEENQWWGTTYLDDVRKVQLILNQIWSGLAEHAKELGTTKAFYPASAQKWVEELTDQPGWSPWPDGAEAPKYMEMPDIGNWYESILDRAAFMIDDIMGVHDVTRGQAPPNLESGSALSILAEKDASPTGRSINEQARIWEETASMCLKIYQQEQKKSREITVDLGFGTERFPHKGSDLSSEFEVSIPEDSLIPRSRAGMMAQADKMLQMGLITDVAQYFSVAQQPGADDMLRGINPHIHKARRENVEMARGEIGDPEDMFQDEHPIHDQEHTSFMLSKRYEMLPQERKELFKKHQKAHKALQAEKEANEIKMAGAQATAEGVYGPGEDPGAMLPPSGPLAGPPGGEGLVPEGMPPEPGMNPADFMDLDQIDSQLEGIMNMNG